MQKTAAAGLQREQAIQQKFYVNRKGYGSTSAGWRRLTRGPGLSMEDAVLASAGNYEQNDCARGTQDMMPFYVWRGDGGLFHQYQ